MSGYRDVDVREQHTREKLLPIGTIDTRRINGFGINPDTATIIEQNELHTFVKAKKRRSQCLATLGRAVSCCVCLEPAAALLSGSSYLSRPCYAVLLPMNLATRSFARYFSHILRSRRYAKRLLGFESLCLLNSINPNVSCAKFSLGQVSS